MPCTTTAPNNVSRKRKGTVNNSTKHPQKKKKTVTTVNDKSTSSSVEEINDEEQYITQRGPHSKNPAHVLKASDGSDDSEIQVIQKPEETAEAELGEDVLVRYYKTCLPLTSFRTVEEKVDSTYLRIFQAWAKSWGDMKWTSTSVQVWCQEL